MKQVESEGGRNRSAEMRRGVTAAQKMQGGRGQAGRLREGVWKDKERGQTVSAQLQRLPTSMAVKEP